LGLRTVHRRNATLNMRIGSGGQWLRRHEDVRCNISEAPFMTTSYVQLMPLSFCILLTSMRCHWCQLWYHRLGWNYCTHEKVRTHQQYTQWQWSLDCRSWVPQIWLQEQLLLCKTCWRQSAIDSMVWNLQNYSLQSSLLIPVTVI